MPEILKELVAVIGEPPGNLVYHFIVFFVLQTAAAIPSPNGGGNARPPPLA
ncbi:MAG: hypothetical protein JNL09_05255 [Anaerolineales bacterium]|nr:hypothetical protein [Anaerolineales bacterium]